MAVDRPGGRPVVFAIPRGGVAVAAGVARALGVPLDVLMVRKIGHPAAPELGLGAIAEDGAGGAAEPYFDPEMLARVGLTRDDLTEVVARERDELARRVAVYGSVSRRAPEAAVPPAGIPRASTEAGSPVGSPAVPGGDTTGAADTGGGTPAGRAVDVAGRLVIVVDDGLATGVTARAALRAVRARGAARSVLAVPVAAAPAVSAIERETGEVVTLVTSHRFRSVGEWYADFGQLTDADVLTLLAAVP
jgi:putative phosphoribosyl transferase